MTATGVRRGAGASPDRRRISCIPRGSTGKVERVRKSPVQFCGLDRRQRRDESGQLPLEHQRKEVTANRRRMRQAALCADDDFGAEAQDLAIHRSADDRGDIVVLRYEVSRDDDVVSRLCATLRNPLAAAIDFAAFHGRACCATSARAWRARRLRCLRRISPSCASTCRFRSRSTNSRSATRTRAERFRRRGCGPVNSSSRWSVASSIEIAIVFILKYYQEAAEHARTIGDHDPGRADRVIE